LNLTPAAPIDGALSSGKPAAQSSQRRVDADWRNPCHQALAYIGIGDKDQAIEALRRMAALGPVRMGLALAVPELDSIRNDPRIRALRKEVGLTP